MPGFLEDCASVVLSDFNGSRLRPDSYQVPLGSAQLSRNVQYSPGQVGTRYGHSVVWNPNKIIAVIHNWLFNFVGTPKNVLLYYAPATGVWLQDLASLGTPSVHVNTVSGQAGAYFAPAGPRIYIAFYDANGVGSAGGHVYSYTTNDDPLFQAPVQGTSITLSEPSAGVVTAGSHKIGFLATTENGFTGKPSPVNGFGAFTPSSFTSAGGKILRVALDTTPWPYQATLAPIMNTVANPAQYYIVPGVTFGVPGGTSFPATLDINISDDDLARTGTAADAYFNKVTIDSSGVAPFKPSVIVMYSSRACYITVDASGIPVCYVSNKDDYQSISLSLSGIQLPGQLVIVTGFVLRQSLYLVGPHWTFVTSDTGDDPVLWQKPQPIDGAIGTFWVRGASVNPTQGFAWVAAESGLYLFEGGSYPALPVSYYQESDWRRINLAVQGIVEDSSTEKKVRVYVALDGATSISHVLSWDYTNGTTPEAVQYSGPDTYSYPIGAATLVQSPIDRRIEEWCAPSAAGYVIRGNNGSETNPYRDVDQSGAAKSIDSLYRTALLPGASHPQGGQINMGHASHLRVRGSGALACRGYDPDGVQFKPLNGNQPVALSPKPGQENIIRFSMNSEQAALEFETNAVDAWFILSWLKYYWTRGPGQR